MGQDVSLLLHVPVQMIAVRYAGTLTSTKECETQTLRLWQYSFGQSIMFYANNSEKVREFERKYSGALGFLC